MEKTDNEGKRKGKGEVCADAVVVVSALGVSVRAKVEVWRPW